MSNSANKKFGSEKSRDVRRSNIINAKSVADSVRTSLGPRGMDKMIQDENGEITVSNDGATILSKMNVTHPASKMMVEISKSQDIEAGDGTTSVVVLAGALLGKALELLDKDIHPSVIADAFKKGEVLAQKYLEEMSTKIDFEDRDVLMKATVTSLSSKVISQHSDIIAPFAVDAVSMLVDSTKDTNVDLDRIRIVKKLGGTLDDSTLTRGLIFNSPVVSKIKGRPNLVRNAKIALIQFHISPPKTNMDNQIVIKEYSQMDRMFREEKKYIINICKQIKKTGANVLLIQKSILRDSVTKLGLHILSKLKIMVIKDIERKDVELISETLGCQPIASVEALHPDKLGYAGLVEEISTGESGRIVKFTDVKNPGKAVSILLRGSNELVVDEAERSLHDALCVVRSLVKKRMMLPGGGAPEIEIFTRLKEYAKTLKGVDNLCITKYAEAFDVIPYTLTENAGMNSVNTIAKLKSKHINGDKYAGIDVKTGEISNLYEKDVIQPLLVSSSAVALATELCIQLLKIDDIVNGR